MYAVQGEPERAMDCLEKAVQHGFAHKAWIENDGDFNSIREHPRYKALLARM
jgi:adenylate cyclase